jgi:signal transduction histidine kinase
MQMRDRMVGIVAHDLRNPVNAIALATAALRGTLTDEQRARQLDIIQRTVGSMDRLIRDLLDVTRMESGQFAIQRAPIQIERLLRETLELFESEALRRKISLSCDPLPEMPALMGDYDRLAQVLSNVLGNALKFTPPGGSVKITVNRSEPYLLFSVQDTGPGVRAEELPFLFNRLWQSTKTAHSEGAGLGLNIAKGIVEAHGGQMWADCPPGSGLRVSWNIPFAPRDEGRSIGAQDAPVADSGQG